MLMEQASLLLNLVDQKLKKFFLLTVMVGMAVMEDEEGMEVWVAKEEIVEMEEMVVLAVIGVMVEMVDREDQVEEEEMEAMQEMEAYV